MTKKSDYFILTVLGLMLAGFLAMAVLAVGVYGFGWDNSISRAGARLVSLPAAMVNGHLVSFSELYDRETMLARALDFQTGQRSAARLQRQQILEDLIVEQIIADLAAQNGVAVTAHKLDRYFSYLLHNFSIETGERDEKILEIFGTTAEEYKNRIVWPDLLEQELRIFLNQNAQDEPNFREAVFVYDRLKNGMDFAEAAQVYSQDERTKYFGGDLGFVSSTELVYWLADPAFDLEVGEISPIITAPDGYYIFKAEEKDSSVDPGKVRLRQIFLRGEDFDAFLESAKKSYNIYAFERIQ